MRRGFTLVEMLVTLSIIIVLIAASIGSYSGITKAAEKARARDLAQQIAQALSSLYENENGQWPKLLASVGETGDVLNDLRGYCLVSGETQYLSLQASGGKLVGYDRFGVLDPWGTAIAKRKGSSTTLADVQDHLYHFAIDADGDGIIKGVQVGGSTLNIRATAVVWCGGKDGKIESYRKGLRGDDIYSWAEGQTRE